MATKKKKGVSLKNGCPKPVRYVDPAGKTKLASVGEAFDASEEWCQRVKERQPEKAKAVGIE